MGASTVGAETAITVASGARRRHGISRPLARRLWRSRYPMGAMVIGAGGYDGTRILRIRGPSNSLEGWTGTLKIDNSSSFSGTIAGQLAIGECYRPGGHHCRRECDDHLFGQQLPRHADGERWNAHRQRSTYGQLFAGKLYSIERRSRWDIRRRPTRVASGCNTQTN